MFKWLFSKIPEVPPDQYACEMCDKIKCSSEEFNNCQKRKDISEIVKKTESKKS